MQLSDEGRGPEGCSIAPACNTNFLMKLHTTHTPTHPPELRCNAQTPCLAAG